jgi:hypothetical protein
VEVQTEKDRDRGRRTPGLILVCVVVVVIGAWWAGVIPADRHAGAVRERVASAVQRFGYNGLATAMVDGSVAELDRAAGSRVWVSAGPTAHVNAEASQWWTFWQPRCVVVEIGLDGHVRSGVVKSHDCFTARLPAAGHRS